MMAGRVFFFFFQLNLAVLLGKQCSYWSDIDMVITLIIIADIY